MSAGRRPAAPVALVVALAACAGEEAPPPAGAGAADSLALVTLDTTRADRLGPYGAAAAETPHLGRLAGAGALFERAYAVTPVTLPSHVSLFSGLDPTAHGVRNNGVPLPPSRGPLLAELLAGHGLRTAAFVSAAVLDRRFGLDRGFEHYDDDLGAGGPRRARLYAERPARATVDAALAWLDELGSEERFFLWVHLFEPHAAYEPPPPFAARFRNRPYDGEIAAMDEQVGRLLGHPRLAGPVAVMAIGDHGESLGEHGEETHAMLAYDATLRVPWIVRLPGGAPGRRLAAPVSQVDLLPTVLELLGLPAAPGLDGVSLAPALAGGAGPAAERPIYGESLVPYYTYGWARLHTLRRGRWKLVQGAGLELYDLENDPGELDDLAGSEPQRAARLERELAELLAGEAAPVEAAAGDRELEARLRGLGYLGGGGEAAQRRRRPDPARLIATHLAFERAAHAFHRRELERAIPELRQVLASDPENLAALTLLAQALSDRLEHAEALALAERAVALAPGLPEPRVALGLAQARRGELEDALAVFEQAIALAPGSLEARIEAALVLLRLDRRPEGVARLREVLAIDDGEPRALIALAAHEALSADQAAAGERRLRQVLAREPFQVEGWRALGRMLELDGRREEAITAYRDGLEAVPEDAMLHARLGLALARLGRDDEAETSLRRAAEELRPGSPAVHNALAGIRLRRGDWPRAEAEARRALELDPSAAAAWNNLAAAREEQGDPEGALAAYGAALAADPAFWQAELNRALLLAAGGRFEDAAAGFLAVTEQLPGHPGAHFELGRLYLGPLADRAAAARHLRIAAEGDPSHPRTAEARRLLSGVR